MILKLSTKLGYDKVYCVSENQYLVLIVSFICSFFILSHKKLLLLATDRSKAVVLV